MRNSSPPSICVLMLVGCGCHSMTYCPHSHRARISRKMHQLWNKRNKSTSSSISQMVDKWPNRIPVPSHTFLYSQQPAPSTTIRTAQISFDNNLANMFSDILPHSIENIYIWIIPFLIHAYISSCLWCMETHGKEMAMWKCNRVVLLYFSSGNDDSDLYTWNIISLYCIEAMLSTIVTIPRWCYMLWCVVCINACVYSFVTGNCCNFHVFETRKNDDKRHELQQQQVKKKKTRHCHLSTAVQSRWSQLGRAECIGALFTVPQSAYQPTAVRTPFSSCVLIQFHLRTRIRLRLRQLNECRRTLWKAHIKTEEWTTTTAKLDE